LRFEPAVDNYRRWMDGKPTFIEEADNPGVWLEERREAVLTAIDSAQTAMRDELQAL
jgi:hypothetical protein